MRTTLTADHVLLPDGVLSPGVVRVEDGTITAADPIGPAGPPAGPDTIRLDGRILMPGLVNSHTHTPMSLLKGVAEGWSLLTKEGWLNRVRALEAGLTPSAIPGAVAVSCAEMIASGTTTFADQYFFAEEIVPTVVRSGLRAAVAYGIVELGDDAARERELAACSEFLERTTGTGPLVRGWVGPHAFFVDNSEQTIEAELALADAHGTGLHAHFATSGEEDAWCRETVGTTALVRMKALGLLDRRVLLAHGCTVLPEDLPLLADTDVSLVFAPNVCMASGASPPPFREALDQGVTVALGTDNVCNNGSYDMFAEMRAMGRLASFVSRVPDAVPARTLLAMATTAGHRALGTGPAAGTIVPGAPADLIAVATADLCRGPVRMQSLESALVYGGSGHAVVDSMVDGRWLMREHTLLTLDASSSYELRDGDADALLGAAQARAAAT
ncbi:amidohydrolase family protein [Pseudonocardia sp. CA-142604]|uniref:amidohydrolase family protein n=1 Tax=Pseudonocardia sp. CA-142604 TaxID=3240024 RepID=UPI003D8F8B12